MNTTKFSLLKNSCPVALIDGQNLTKYEINYEGIA